MNDSKKHTDKIATSILRGEYSDYDKNWWHYDREYNMLLKAQTEAFKLANEAAEQQDKEAIDTVVAVAEQKSYTSTEIESFAEWCSRKGWGYSYKDKEWSNMRPVYQIKTTTQLRELWEQEMDVNTSEPPNIKQQCPECGDESYNSDGDYCLNSNCKLFII